MSFGEYHRDAAKRIRATNMLYLDTETYRNCELEQFAKLLGTGSENILKGRFGKILATLYGAVQAALRRGV